MSNISIMVDAGHYGKYNQSPAVPAYYESEAMWKLHLMFREELEKLGIKAPGTREDPAKDLYVTNRGLLGKGHTALISMHSNSTADGKVNEGVDYVRAYCLVPDDSTDIDEQSRALGEKLAKVVAEVMGVKQGYQVVSQKSDKDKNGDGILNDNYYGILNGARQAGVPALILEHSFHTNTAATKWLMDEGNLRKLAQAEAKVIAEHYGVAAQEKWYRIRKSWEDAGSQVAAYLDLQLAIDHCPEGYGVYDWNGKCVSFHLPKPTTYTLELPTLRKGDSGDTVKAVQDLLIAAGYNCGGSGADGIFGTNTEAAVIHYQCDHSLAGDGIVGPDTMGVLLGIK